MTETELLEKLRYIRKTRCETRTLEIKAAASGCPKRLYDTLSSFSNQDDGGVIVFGVDEENGFTECGVYDPQDLQKKINEQCRQMAPAVRPLLTVAEKDGRYFVAAEIPGIDLADRPCYYMGRGRLKGSYTRVGDSDEPMTDYEIYSYESFRKKYRDDIRTVPRASIAALDRKLLETYVERLRDNKANLSSLTDDELFELMSITRDGEVTLSSIMLLCKYPQAFFPQLCVTAVVLPHEEDGEPGEFGERFIDNRRIEGSIPEMLSQTLDFVRKNMRTKTIIDPATGKREDRTEYPVVAVREAVLNALVHRDYSVHTEGIPIQVRIYPDRLEITNPGGLYGRLRIDQLGKKQADIRNPVLVTAMEVLGLTENRYSGIPTIRRAMERYGLKEPVFADERSCFSVTFYNGARTGQETDCKGSEEKLLEFLRTPRDRHEIAGFLGISTVTYAMRKYIDPLVAAGRVGLTEPGNPKGRKQKYYSI